VVNKFNQRSLLIITVIDIVNLLKPYQPVLGFDLKLLIILAIPVLVHSSKKLMLQSWENVIQEL